MTQQGTVRFITPFEEGDEGPDRVQVSRIEGMRSCRRCSRLHPYQVGLINPGEEMPAEDLLADSWEDARHQVLEWLPEGSKYCGGRAVDDDNEAEVFLFDTRAEAIQWLLEPVPA